MAITRHLAELILAEHCLRPIAGNMLLLGRQTIFMKPDEALALVRRFGIEPQGTPQTADFGDPGNISDRSFFSLFSAAKIVACDVTDHEGADLIFDLSADLPADLHGRFDFIYNGSVLDNVFDPAACLRNVSRMLAPAGRVLGYEGTVGFSTSFSYCRFSPEWFFDYFALNQFADVQCYVASYRDIHADSWQLYEWSPYAGDHFAGDLAMSGELLSLFVAEKGVTSTVDRTPVQNYYRPDHKAYREAADLMEASSRRAHYLQAFPALRPGWFAKTKPLPRGYRALGRLG